jgi:hypothetical protein
VLLPNVLVEGARPHPRSQRGASARVFEREAAVIAKKRRLSGGLRAATIRRHASFYRPGPRRP